MYSGCLAGPVAPVGSLHRMEYTFTAVDQEIRMPIVEFRGEEIECEENAVLRDVLKGAENSPHNGKAKYANCHGNGTCGTCAVQVTGEISEKGRKESVRLGMPPHHPSHDIRLSCQARVQGDITVLKYPGLFGQHLDQDPLPPTESTDSDTDTETEA